MLFSKGTSLLCQIKYQYSTLMHDDWKHLIQIIYYGFNMTSYNSKKSAKGPHSPLFYEKTMYMYLTVSTISLVNLLILKLTWT